MKQSRTASGSRTNAPAQRGGSSLTKVTPVKTAPDREAKVEPSSSSQWRAYDKAMDLFRKREFAAALPLFEEVARGPSRDMAHAAMMHINMCRRRLSENARAPETPEERYVFAVAEMNAGRLDSALVHLQKAVEERAQADHFHYALALCWGLKGDIQKAAAHLRTAIDLEPKNRVAAKRDPDFQALLRHPEIRAILDMEKKRSE
jgi:tetratricopeptide (TPR) repeat protein